MKLIELSDKDTAIIADALREYLETAEKKMNTYGGRTIGKTMMQHRIMLTVPLISKFENL